MKKLRFFVVSDSVGETGERAVKAVVSQFRPSYHRVSIRRFPHIQNKEELERIVEMAKNQQAVLIYTLVEKAMRDYLFTMSKQAGVSSIDLLGPMMDMIEGVMNERPLELPGLVYQLNDDYFEKIEAIEFAVKYDDGRDPKGVLLADIVLIGVSRTSKTPLSQYLAHKSLKVANVPLIPELDPPEELLQVDAKKCFGLVISPQKLKIIREERLKMLGLYDGAMYAQERRIEQELEHFHRVVERLGCDVIDVTNKAVEETANIILRKVQQSR